MNALTLATTFDENYHLPLAHEAAAILRIQYAGISMALKCLQRGNDLDIPQAIAILKGAL